MPWPRCAYISTASIKMRIALPLPPLALGAARQIRRVAPLEHHALDRLGIVARAGAGWIFPRGGQRVPTVEWDRRRQIDSGVIQFADEGLKPGAALDKRQRAQIGLALTEQIIGAQMDRIFLDQLWRDRLYD